MNRGIYAAVLAAGSASRFGSTKQLAEVNGASLVATAVRIANESCNDRTVVVVGHDASAVSDEIRATAGFVVVNDRYAEGMGTSIARAVTSIGHAASAIVVLLADQPKINVQHVADLVDAWSGDSNEIVATSFGGTQGPPVLFPSGCFDELRDLAGDTGGKHLFNDERFSLRTVAFEPAAIDVDTPGDLRQIERSARS